MRCRVASPLGFAGKVEVVIAALREVDGAIAATTVLVVVVDELVVVLARVLVGRAAVEVVIRRAVVATVVSGSVSGGCDVGASVGAGAIVVVTTTLVAGRVEVPATVVDDPPETVDVVVTKVVVVVCAPTWCGSNTTHTNATATTIATHICLSPTNRSRTYLPQPTIDQTNRAMVAVRTPSLGALHPAVATHTAHQ